MTTNIIICGNENFNDYELLKKEMDRLTVNLKRINVLSGHSKGADRLGEEWANERGHMCLIYHVDLATYDSRVAYIKRDEEMVGDADCCVAFWDGKSRGTKNILKIAKKNKIKIRITRV